MYYLELKVMEMFSELLVKDSVHYKTLSAKVQKEYLNKYFRLSKIPVLQRGGCGHILGLFSAANPRLCPHPLPSLARVIISFAISPIQVLVFL